MGRELKRVPLDFNWPINKIWPGYMVSFESEIEDYNPEAKVEELNNLEFIFAKAIGAEIKLDEDGKFSYANYKCLEPPTGVGFQLWENTSEGSPQSPVFETLELLCEYLENSGASVFGENTTTKEKWFEMLSDGFVSHTEGNLTFV